MKKIILTLIIFFLLPGITAAEEILKANVDSSDKVLYLSFYEAVNMAIRENKKLQAFKNRVNAREGFISVQRGDFLPSVNFNQGFVWTNNPAEVFALKLNQRNLTAGEFAGAPASFNNPDPFTNFLSEITLEQSVYNKENSVNLKIAKNRYSAKENEYLRTREKVVLEVARAYLNVKNAVNFVKVAQQSIEAAKEHKRIANVRYENETGLYSDVLRTNTFLKKAEQRFVSVQKNYEIAKKALGLAIGVTNSVETVDTVPELQPLSLKAHKNNALNRSDIKAMEINYEKAKNKIKLQQALYYPKVTAGGNYRVYSEYAPFGFEGENFTLFGALKWNLFNGRKKPNLVKIAEYELKETKNMLEDARNLAEFEVFDAYQTVMEKQKNFELAISTLESAEEGMKLVEIRYKNSLSPIIDVLDAQLNLDQARADVAKSRNEYLFSLINLRYASGMILNDFNLN